MRPANYILDGTTITDSDSTDAANYAVLPPNNNVVLGVMYALRTTSGDATVQVALAAGTINASDVLTVYGRATDAAPWVVLTTVTGAEVTTAGGVTTSKQFAPLPQLKVGQANVGDAQYDVWIAE